MNASHTCPSAESLLHLLDARLPESQQLEVTEHVDSCVTCQEKLESLVTHGLREDLHFEYAGEYLREAGARTTLPPAARQRLTTALSERTTADSAASEELFLELLQSSQEEGSLGRLGQFEITEVIGRGGMGIVLKGRDTRLDRVVALKVLAPEVASNPTARKRFLREAQAAAAVSHDHVVTTFAVEPGKLPYLAMEYIDGLSLQQKIDRDAPLELREILRIGMQTAYGLAAAHTQGLIHRDIKPSNILLQNGVERVQITDFGLARAVDDVSITRTGEVTGTPQYMSPEQAQGRPVDHRADLFSLGSVLYAMCTGRSPFRADSTVAVINRVCNDTPRPIDEINPEIPAWLSTIIDRLLQKDPADRFRSAAEVADLLSQCLAHVQQPAVVPLPELLPQSNRVEPFRLRRFKWYAGAILLAAVLGSLGLAEATGVTRFSASVISIVRGDGTLLVEVNDPEVSVTIEGEDIVITGAGPKEVRLKPGRYKLKASKDGKTVSLDQQLVTITRGGKQVVHVTLEGENVEAAAGNGRAGYTSVPPGAVREVQRFEGHTYFLCPRSLAFTADGREVFSGQTGWWLPTRLALWDVATGTAIRRFDDPEAKGGVRCVAVSPTARIGASGHHENGGSLIHLWDLDSGKRIRTLSGHAGLVVALDFSPDGKRLVSVTGGKNADGTARVWDVGSGKEIVRGEFAVGGESLAEIEDPLTELCDVRFSPDGKTFLVAQPQLGVMLCDAQTGRPMKRFDVLKTSAVRTAAFSPDGRYLAAGGQGAYLAIHLYDVQTGKKVRRFAGHSDTIYSVRFTADGRFLVSGAKDRTLRVWDVAAGREVARVLCENHVTNAVAVSPNGKHVVSAGGVHNQGKNENVVEGDYEIRLWQLPESVWPENAVYKSVPPGAISEVRRLKSPSRVGFIRSLGFSPDGRHLLCGRSGTADEVWDLNEFQPSYLQHDGPTTETAISPDGRWAAATDYGPPFCIRLWDLDKGIQIRQFRGHTKYVRSVSFSPDGKRLLSGGSDATARIWDVQTGEEVHRIAMDAKVSFGVFSPDGRTALIGYRELALIDVEKGKELWRRDPPGQHSFTAAFSPDGKMVAAAFQNHGSHEIQLFDAATGEKKRRCLGHSWIVRNLCFLPDGRHLISGSSDKTLRLWNVATGNEVARVEASEHFTTYLSVSPEGRTVASGGGHFKKPPGYKMRAHDIQAGDSRYAKDGDYDIRLWRLPESVWPEPSAPEKETPGEADQRDSSPDSSPSEDSP
jgi:WD40 repeat protein